MPFSVVGSPHWTSGPICLAPRALHERWAAAFAPKIATQLKRLKGAVVVAKLDGTSMVLLVGQERVGVDSGKDLTVLSSMDVVDGHLLDDDVKRVLKQAPHASQPADAWVEVGRLDIAEPYVWFDAWARDPLEKGRRRSVASPLQPGKYTIEQIAKVPLKLKLHAKKSYDVVYRLVRIRKLGATVRTRPAPPVVVDDGPLVATREVIAAAKRLRSIGGTEDGGPVVMPRRLANRWFGIFDEAGEVSETAPDHSELVFEMNGVGVAKFAGAQILGNPSDTSAFFHPTATGGLLITWQGADSHAGCLAAALSIADDEWTRTKLRWKVGDGDLIMFGHRLDGRALKKADQLAVRLAPGTYRVEVASTEAIVRVGKQDEDTSVSVIRLTRT